MDEAESAKASVRNYRKKLHRVKSDVDDLKEQTRGNADWLEKLDGDIGEVYNMAVGYEGDIRDLRNNKADEKESRERLRKAKRDVEDENRRLAETVGMLERDVEDAQDSIEGLSAENTALQERLDASESELEKSWTKKIRRR